MLFRFQVDADDNGMIRPSTIQAFDAEVSIDPVTDTKRRGDLRKIDIPPDARQRIADVINAELGGAAKATERLAAARKAHLDRKAEDARLAKEEEARLIAEQEREKTEREQREKDQAKPTDKKTEAK